MPLTIDKLRQAKAIMDATPQPDHIVVSAFSCGLPDGEPALNDSTEIPAELAAWAALRPDESKKAFNDAWQAHIDSVWEKLEKENEEEVSCQH